AIKAINFVIEGLNKLPNVEIAKIDTLSDSAFMEGFRSMANEIRDKVGVVRGELHDMAMQPRPSTQVSGFFADVEQRAGEAAARIVALREEAQAAADSLNFNFGVTGDDDSTDEREREAEERRQDLLSGRL